MRLVIVCLLVAACTPDIAPGSYLCGPEQLCPEGQSCNGPDNVCVVTSAAMPFACETDLDPPGDDAPATAQPLGALDCVSALRVTKGCMSAGDVADWYQFDVPASCVTVQVEATLAFPIAYETLDLQLSTNLGPGSVVEGTCPPSRSPDEGEAQRCFEMTVTPGTRYALGVVPDGTGDCDRACAFNRYRLSMQLATP